MERRKERLIYRFTREENGLTLRRYWTSSCGACAIKSQSTPSTQRRVARWEHERLLEAEQRRLEINVLLRVVAKILLAKASFGLCPLGRRLGQGDRDARRLARQNLRAVEVVVVSAPRSSSSTRTSIARTGLFSPILSSRHFGKSAPCPRSAPSTKRFMRSGNGSSILARATHGTALLYSEYHGSRRACRQSNDVR
jgi:hypothetical protein